MDNSFMTFGQKPFGQQTFGRQTNDVKKFTVDQTEGFVAV